MEWFSVLWRVLLLLIMLRLVLGKWGGSLVSVNLTTHVHPTEHIVCDCDDEDNDGEDDTAEFPAPPIPAYHHPCPSKN